MKQGYVLWLLGPTSSGKTTIATNYLIRMKREKINIIHFDGDEVRDFFGPDHGFQPDDRLKVVNILVYLANKSSETGMNVVISALTANIEAREYVLNNTNNLIVGYIKCSINECAKRDPKGLYKKAKLNKIDTLIGFNSEYIEPENYDFIIDTEKSSINNSTQQIIDFLQNNSKK